MIGIITLSHKPIIDAENPKLNSLSIRMDDVNTIPVRSYKKG